MRYVSIILVVVVIAAFIAVPAVMLFKYRQPSLIIFATGNPLGLDGEKDRALTASAYRKAAESEAGLAAKHPDDPMWSLSAGTAQDLVVVADLIAKDPSAAGAQGTAEAVSLLMRICDRDRAWDGLAQDNPRLNDARKAAGRRLARSKAVVSSWIAYATAAICADIAVADLPAWKRVAAGNQYVSDLLVDPAAMKSRLESFVVLDVDPPLAVLDRTWSEAVAAVQTADVASLHSLTGLRPPRLPAWMVLNVHRRLREVAPTPLALGELRQCILDAQTCASGSASALDARVAAIWKPRADLLESLSGWLVEHARSPEACAATVFTIPGRSAASPTETEAIKAIESCQQLIVASISEERSVDTGARDPSAAADSISAAQSAVVAIAARWDAAAAAAKPIPELSQVISIRRNQWQQLREAKAWTDFDVLVTDAVPLPIRICALRIQRTYLTWSLAKTRCDDLVVQARSISEKTRAMADQQAWADDVRDVVRWVNAIDGAVDMEGIAAVPQLAARPRTVASASKDIAAIVEVHMAFRDRVADALVSERRALAPVGQDPTADAVRIATDIESHWTEAAKVAPPNLAQAVAARKTAWSRLVTARDWASMDTSTTDRSPAPLRLCALRMQRAYLTMEVARARSEDLVRDADILTANLPVMQDQATWAKSVRAATRWATAVQSSTEVESRASQPPLMDRDSLAGLSSRPFQESLLAIEAGRLRCVALVDGERALADRLDDLARRNGMDVAGCLDADKTALRTALAACTKAASDFDADRLRLSGVLLDGTVISAEQENLGRAQLRRRQMAEQEAPRLARRNADGARRIMDRILGIWEAHDTSRVALQRGEWLPVDEPATVRMAWQMWGDRHPVVVFRHQATAMHAYVAAGTDLLAEPWALDRKPAPFDHVVWTADFAKQWKTDHDALWSTAHIGWHPDLSAAIASLDREILAFKRGSDQIGNKEYKAAQETIAESMTAAGAAGVMSSARGRILNHQALEYTTYITTKHTYTIPAWSHFKVDNPETTSDMTPAKATLNTGDGYVDMSGGFQLVAEPSDGSVHVKINRDFQFTWDSGRKIHLEMYRKAKTAYKVITVGFGDDVRIIPKDNGDWAQFEDLDAFARRLGQSPHALGFPFPWHATQWSIQIPDRPIKPMSLRAAEQALEEGGKRAESALNRLGDN